MFLGIIIDKSPCFSFKFKNSEEWNGFSNTRKTFWRYMYVRLLSSPEFQFILAGSSSNSGDIPHEIQNREILFRAF